MSSAEQGYPRNNNRKTQEPGTEIIQNTFSYISSHKAITIAFAYLAEQGMNLAHAQLPNSPVKSFRAISQSQELADLQELAWRSAKRPDHRFPNSRAAGLSREAD